MGERMKKHLGFYIAIVALIVQGWMHVYAINALKDRVNQLEEIAAYHVTTINSLVQEQQRLATDPGPTPWKITKCGWSDKGGVTVEYESIFAPTQGDDWDSRDLTHADTSALEPLVPAPKNATQNPGPYSVTVDR
jgi:hypothetical protein